MRSHRPAGPRCTLVAVHVHVGSQITSLEPLRRLPRRIVAGVAARARHAAGRRSSTSIWAAASGIPYDGGRRAVGASTSSALGRCRASDRAADRRRARPLDRRPGGRLLARGSIDLKPRNAISEFVGRRRRHDRADAPGAALARFTGSSRCAPRLATAQRRTRSSDRSARAATSSAAIASCRRWQVGDLPARIRDAGACGAAMASNYNRRPLPAEVLVDAGALARRSPPAERRRHARDGGER